MKKLLFLFLMLPVTLSAQKIFEADLLVEIKDTVETAYFHYSTGNMIQDGFTMVPEVKKKFMGLDSIRITRLFYYVPASNKSNYFEGFKLKKVYIDFQIKEYLSKRKGNDFAEYKYL